MGLLTKVKWDKEDVFRAEQLARERKIPRNDILHALLAEKAHAIMVSQDVYFQQLRDITRIATPEELL
jgi:hypothetical protein